MNQHVCSRVEGFRVSASHAAPRRLKVGGCLKPSPSKISADMKKPYTSLQAELQDAAKQLKELKPQVRTLLLVQAMLKCWHIQDPRPCL